MYRMMRALVALLALTAAVTLTACATEEDAGSNGGDKKTAKGDKKAAKGGGGDGCGTTATDDCTPRVGPDGKVRVDALIWSVQNVEVRDSIGDMTYGLGEEADGKFVVVTLKVRSDKNESATLTDNAFQLDANGNTYDTDTEGTIAAVGDGEDPLFFEDIGPDSTLTGKVVYDVPAKVLKRGVAMRFNELGFGETHAFIDLGKIG